MLCNPVFKSTNIWTIYKKQLKLVFKNKIDMVITCYSLVPRGFGLAFARVLKSLCSISHSVFSYGKWLLL